MPPTRPISFSPQPITIKTQQATARPGLGVDMSPGGRLSAPVRPSAYTGGPVVEVVKNVPANLKSAAPASLGSNLSKAAGGIAAFGQKVVGGIAAFGGKVVGGVAGAIAADLLFPESVGMGSDMVGGKPISSRQTQAQPQTQARRSPIGDPRLDNRTRYSPQAQPQTSGRVDPFAPIAPQFEFDEPTKPAPFVPPSIPGLDTTPRGALSTPIRGATGRINLAPIAPSNENLSTPSTLDQIGKGGVNLLNPIVDFLKKLDLDIQQLKNPDFSPLLQEISKLIAPILAAIVAAPEIFNSAIVAPILDGILELLEPVTNLVATNVEISAKNPRTTSEAVAEMVAPIFLLLTLLGTALDGIGKAISGLTLRTGIQVPQGMAVAAQIPMGMAVAAQIPMGMAATAQIPMGMAAAAQIPMGMAAAAQIPMGMTVLAGLPQTVTATADLTAVDLEIQNLQKLIQKTKDDLDKCCKDIQEKLKKKKKEDDDRFPEFKNSGQIECDGATIPYNYSGVGLSGLYQQNNVILGISKMMLKKVCDNEIEFPLIQGGGTFVCDESFGSYNYSGVGLLGLQSQIDRVLDFNRKILNEVCDIEVEAPSFSFPDIFGGGTYVCDGSIVSYGYSGAGFIGLSNQIGELTKVSTKILAEVCDDGEDIFGSINFTDCDGGTQVLLYSGDGSVGLSSQISALTELQKLTYAKACETSNCVPVQPGDEFAEFDVPRQLVLTWGEQYPTQKGSLWHTQIPNPREDLDWCRDFDNLIYTKGNIYGRWLWGGSKIKSGMRCVDEDEADRILDLIGALTTTTGKKRFTKGGGVKLNPAVRSVRCVRAAIAELDSNGIAVAVRCFVPPIEGC